MPLDMGKLEEWLLHFLDGNPFHQKEFADRPLGLPLWAPWPVSEVL